MNDLARENDPLCMTGDGPETLQQPSNNNHASAVAVAAAASPRASNEMTTSEYPLPPPLDDDNYRHGATIEGWSGGHMTTDEPFQSTGAAPPTTTTTTSTNTVADYNNNDASAEEVAPFSNVSVDGFDKIYSHPPIMDSSREPQQSHFLESEGSSTTTHPVTGQPLMPSQGGDEQHQLPYNFNDSEDRNHDSNSRKRAYHGFASSTGVPDLEQKQPQQQEVDQYSPPQTLPPIHSQYPPYNHHPYYHHYSSPHQHYAEQQQQQQQQHPHPRHQEQQQGMNDSNYENIHMIHEQQYPPLPHHSSPYNNTSPPLLDVQQHYHQHHPYQQQQQQHHHHDHLHQHDYNQLIPPLPPSFNHHVGFNTDRPTYLFSLPTDSQSLSDRQCYIRSNFIELFIATEHDVSARPAKGSQKIHVGQIGIRCAYCVVVDNNNASSSSLLLGGEEGGSSTNQRKVVVAKQQHQQPRVERAVCYPQSISRIYQTVADMQRRHFEKCTRIPVRVMGTYKSLKSTRPRGKGNPQAYWESSAREIGLVDSLNGMGIRVMGKEEEEGGGDGEGMVERFLLQRKNGNVEGVGFGGGGDDGANGGVVEHHSSERSMAAPVEEGDDDYEKKPRAKRLKFTKEDNETSGGGEEDDQSSNMQSQMSGGQETIISAVNYTEEQQPPPPISSFSDAHLLASMRDGASPSLNEKEAMMMMQHGRVMLENNVHELERHRQQPQQHMTGADHNDKGDNLVEELTHHYLNELEMSNRQTGQSDANSADVATNGTLECDIKVIEEV